MLLLKLAIRNIFRQRRRSLLTALSMSGGYVLCAIAFSVSEGSYNNAIRFFTLDHTGHVQIHKGNYLRRPRLHKTIDDPAALSETLDNNDNIEHHTLRVFAPALAYSDTDNTQVNVIGVDPTREKRTSRLAKKVTSGNYISDKVNPDSYYSAMIGTGIATSLNISIGDELILISQGADGSVANDIYIVGAIVGNKDSLDKSSVFLPLDAAQEFLSMQGKIHEVAILLKDESKSREFAASLQKQLPELSIDPWQIVEETFYMTMQADQQGMQAMLFIIIFIVFIGVLNTVLMSVLERTREFGVLKAIGTRPKTIVSLITLETALLSMMSFFVGLVFAIPIIAWFAFVGIELPEPVDFGGVQLRFFTGEISTYVFATPLAWIMFFALLVCIPAGIRAGRILPTQAMGSH